jgi:hypothetical protein
VFANSLLLSPYLETKSQLMQLDLGNANGPLRLNYLSNFVLTGGVRFRYKWLNFQLGARLPVKQFDAQLGKTGNFSLGLSLVKRKYMLQTRFETYSGFYLQNTQDWIPNYKTSANSSFYLRPDLNAQSLFTVYNYILNHKRYSNPAAVFQFERQRRAAFGIALGASHMYNRIEADSSLIPSLHSLHPNATPSTFLVSHMLGLQVGLMGTVPLFAKRRWYVTASLIPGISLQTGRNTRGIKLSLPSQFFSGITNELRFGCGYNAQKWFAALQITSIGNTVKISEVEIYRIQNAYFRVSTGIRFGK